jgi:holliday junction DNA helicase RuvA
MIATLTGLITEQIDDYVVLDVGGVGYGVFVTSEDAGTLTAGKKTKLFIYENIKEQNYDLFGFSSIENKKIFELLLSVNGVGPKMALALLSVGDVDDVRTAIAQGNTKFLQAANGVGKKVAERVIVDLKDKVGFSVSDSATSFLTVPSSKGDDAHVALMSLGYSAQQASELLAEIDVKLSTEERVNAALRGVKN